MNVRTASSPRARRRTAYALGIALVTASVTARAQQRYVASGQRLLTVTRRVADSEGDRHALRARLPATAPTSSALRCATISRGEPFGVPVVLSDGSMVLPTQRPGGLAWFSDGRLVRQVFVSGTVIGTAVEGADGRVILVDDTPSVRAFAPDGTLRSTVALPSAPQYGATALNDGTLLVPVGNGSSSDFIVLNHDLSQLSRVRLNASLASNPYLFRGMNGSLWFGTTAGPHVIDGVRPFAEPLSWARSAIAAWQVDDDTLVVQFTASTPAELRFTSLSGAQRATVSLVDQIFLLPRGHVALAQPLYHDPNASANNTSATGARPGSGGATSSSAASNSAGSGGATIGPVPRPFGWRPGSSRFSAPDREQTHTELVVYDRRGVVVTRALLPPLRPLGVLLDPDDAVLVVTTNGRAFAVEPGGVLRWQVDLAITPTQDAVATADGGFAVSVLRPRPGVCVMSGDEGR
jgi:hypothetical protein